LRSKDLKKKFVHLTNYSVNKSSSKFNGSNTGEGTPPADSSKWSMTQLKQAFKNHSLNFDGTFAQIKDVILKALITVEPHITSNLNK